MEIARNCNRCEACRYAFYNPDPVKSHYFYVEGTTNNCTCSTRKSVDKENMKKDRKRSYSKEERSRSVDGKDYRKMQRTSNAGDNKTEERKRSLSCGSNQGSFEKRKSGSSEELKPLKAGRERSRSRDESPNTDCIEQLKKDLRTIKEQLCVIGQNRNEALDVTNELQIRYRQLLQRNEEQQREIDCLRQKNDLLCQQVCGQDLGTTATPQNGRCTCNDPDETKGYDEKLSELYNQCTDTTQLAPESREEICECLRRQSENFRRLSETVVEKDSKYSKLKKCYCKTKDNEQKCMQENRELRKELNTLQCQFNKVMEELERFRSDSATTVARQDDMREKCQDYIRQLEEKSKKINELGLMVEELKNHVKECTNKADDSYEWQTKYEELLVKYNALVKKFKSNEECDKKSM